MDYVFHFDVFRNYAASFFQACLLTFKLAGICIVFTTVFGAICGALLTSGSKVVKGVVKVYVEAFRLTPFLVQLLFFYFGIPLFLGIKISSSVAGVVTLSLNGAAYAAETFRAGFQSVPTTQMQAGLSLGYTKRPQVWPWHSPMPALVSRLSSPKESTPLAMASLISLK